MDQLTTDPLVELNGITYVLASAYMYKVFADMYMLSIHVCVYSEPYKVLAVWS